MSADCGHLEVRPQDADQLGPHGAAALMYARIFGMPVLRIKPGSAEPNLHRGVHAATTDQHLIRRWFASGPESNLAARTGRGWLVVDLDRKNGQDGPAELVKFMDERCVSLPPVPWVTTPSGGRHLWLRTPGETPSRSSSGRIIPGVDLVADGGHYVLLPPSLKTVKFRPGPGDPKTEDKMPLPYTWAPGSCLCRAPMAPAWLLEAIRTLPSTGAAGNSGGSGAHHGLSGELPATDELTKSGLTPGSRNCDLYRLAVRLWRQHGQNGGSAVVATCRLAWAATPQRPDPFPWEEAQGRIASARRWVAHQEAAERRTNASFARYLEQGRVA